MLAGLLTLLIPPFEGWTFIILMSHVFLSTVNFSFLSSFCALITNSCQHLALCQLARVDTYGGTHLA